MAKVSGSDRLGPLARPVASPARGFGGEPSHGDNVGSMTKGQALYLAACQAIGLDPDERGTQARLAEQCDDIASASVLSRWASGKLDPSDAVVRQMEKRFRFKLEHLGWIAVHEGEA